jgi:hypothetical protein
MGSPATRLVYANPVNSGSAVVNLALVGCVWICPATPSTFIDLQSVNSVQILNNRYYVSGTRKILKARDCQDVMIGGGTESTYNTTNQFDVDASNTITWMTQSGLAMNTTLPLAQSRGLQIGPASIATNALAVRSNGGFGGPAYSPSGEPATCKADDVLRDATSLKFKYCTASGSAEGGSGRGTWVDVPARHRITSITASTTQTQGQGALTAEENVVTVCANANDTVTLPSVATWTASGRYECFIVNTGAQTLQVFPASGNDLGAGLNTSTTITAGSKKRFYVTAANTWKDIT